MINTQLVNATEALRMLENSKADNPYIGTTVAAVWEIAHTCAISCVEAARVEPSCAEWLVPDEHYPDTCSNCKFEFVWDGDNAYVPKFCPDCGAKMTDRKLLYK